MHTYITLAMSPRRTCSDAAAAPKAVSSAIPNGFGLYNFSSASLMLLVTWDDRIAQNCKEYAACRYETSNISASYQKRYTNGAGASVKKHEGKPYPCNRRGNTRPVPYGYPGFSKVPSMKNPVSVCSWTYICTVPTPWLAKEDTASMKKCTTSVCRSCTVSFSGAPCIQSS